MKTLIMFGRSPFVPTVDVDRLISLYDTMGFNNFASHYPVTTSWCVDAYVKPMSDRTEVFGRVDRPGQYPEGVTLIQPLIYPYPLVPERRDPTNNALELGWRKFSPCLGINWAILQGYTDICFVGIDHVPTDTKFKHFDGIDNKHGQNMSELMHTRFREYVENATKHIRIWQTNPAVRQYWNLPFRSIEKVYSGFRLRD